MKVLHINCNYLGTALHQCMVEHMDRLGVDSTVFVPTYSPATSIKPNDNVIIDKCFRKWDRIAFYHKQKKIRNALEHRLSVDRFDLLHAYTLFTDGNCAYELSKKYGVDYVVALRNTDVNHFFKWMPHLRKRGIQIMRSAKAVFFLSESYKQEILQKYVPPVYHKEICEKSHIVPNGVDDFWLENLQTDTNRTVAENTVKLVYAGRIDANKNIPTTQAAMKLLMKKGYAVHLTVVGNVKDKKVFEQIQKDDFTTYIPPKNKAELINIYRDNDIFVMPSYTESFGLVYVEAISQGLPVVYTAGQGFDKQFSEGEVGYSVDSHSAESVADAIDRIAQNYDAITNNLAAKARRYDWNRICTRYCSIYESIF